MSITRNLSCRAGSALLALTILLGQAGCASAAPPAAEAPSSVAGPNAPMPAPQPQDQAVTPASTPGAPSAGMKSAGADAGAKSAGAPAAAPNGNGNSNAKTTGAPNAPASAAKGKQTAAAEATAVLVAYVGDLGMIAESEQIPATLDNVVDIAESLGGHLGGRTDTSVKVKIPSKRFREGMSMIEKLGEVTKRSVTADDVTAEFNDLEVRLENLRATRKRLEEFLAKAASIADTLTVEQQLERVASEIDNIQGRMRFLRDATSFSTLTVAVAARPKPKPVEVAVVTPPPPPPPPQAPRVVSLPISWLGEVGIGALLDLQKKN